jgi:hypothetical protein
VLDRLFGRKGNFTRFCLPYVVTSYDCRQSSCIQNVGPRFTKLGSGLCNLCWQKCLEAYYYRRTSEFKKHPKGKNETV